MLDQFKLIYCCVLLLRPWSMWSSSCLPSSSTFLPMVTNGAKEFDAAQPFAQTDGAHAERTEESAEKRNTCRHSDNATVTNDKGNGKNKSKEEKL